MANPPPPPPPPPPWRSSSQIPREDSTPAWRSKGTKNSGPHTQRGHPFNSLSGSQRGSLANPLPASQRGPPANPLPPTHPNDPPSTSDMKSLDPMRPSSRRAASGAWTRLKPVREDLLEQYGLPSKGETRLNDFKTQQVYFNRIIERYMKLCALNRDELDSLFASVSSANNQDLSSSFSSLSLSQSKHAVPQQVQRQQASCTTHNGNTSIPANALTPSTSELATVLSALRKLREAITATNRCDAFARRAYFFAIHVSVLCADWSSYVPALSSLLTHMHARSPLSAPDLKEYVGLLMLDQACRQSDVALARATKLAYGYADWRVEGVLSALVRDDYVTFWRLRRAVDGYQRSVMRFASTNVRVHALKCLGRSYLSVERAFVERVAERSWDELVGDGVGWELSGDGEKVVIRKPRGGLMVEGGKVDE